MRLALGGRASAMSDMASTEQTEVGNGGGWSSTPVNVRASQSEFGAFGRGAPSLWRSTLPPSPHNRSAFFTTATTTLDCHPRLCLHTRLRRSLSALSSSDSVWYCKTLRAHIGISTSHTGTSTAHIGTARFKHCFLRCGGEDRRKVDPLTSLGTGERRSTSWREAVSAASVHSHAPHPHPPQ